MTIQNSWNTPYLSADGQVLIGSTGARPSASLITEGTNVTILNTAGGIEVQTSPISDWVVVQRDTVTSPIAFIDYVCRISDFRALVLVGNNHQPATTTGLGIGISSDGGATFDTTASNYRGLGWQVDEGASTDYLDDSALVGGKLQIFGSTLDNAGSGANQISSFICTIWNPSNTQWTKSSCYSYYNNTSTDPIIQFWGCQHRSTSATNALRLKQSSGNIGQGHFVMYGIIK